MKPKEWEKKGSKEIFSNPWLTLREDVLVDERGKTLHFAIVQIMQGASVLPIDPGGNVYLVKQYRPGLGSMSIETPGGKVDAGETPTETAQRETLEEIGVEVSNLISLGTIAGLTGNLDHIEHLFLAKLNTVPKPVLQSEEEVLELITAPMEQAVQWALDSTIVHGPAIALILRAKEYLKK